MNAEFNVLHYRLHTSCKYKWIKKKLIMTTNTKKKKYMVYLIIMQLLCTTIVTRFLTFVRR